MISSLWDTYKEEEMALEAAKKEFHENHEKRMNELKILSIEAAKSLFDDLKMDTPDDEFENIMKKLDDDIAARQERDRKELDELMRSLEDL